MSFASRRVVRDLFFRGDHAFCFVVEFLFMWGGVLNYKITSVTIVVHVVCKQMNAAH